MRRSAPAVVALAALAGLLLVGCGPASPTPANDTATVTAGPALQGELTVFAAASLTGAFTEIADDFESAHPGVTVTLNFAGSSALVTQLDEGADADVFASADEATMVKAQDADLTDGDSEIFATNTLEIAVPPGNPADIASFADLAMPGLALVVCAPQVPCGAATQRVADAVGVTLSPVSEEGSVTDVLGKVAAGEADAGVVYRTDVAAATDTVEGIAFAEAADAVNRYPIATLAGSAHPAAAAAFAAFVMGESGQATLARFGFGAGDAANG